MCVLKSFNLLSSSRPRRLEKEMLANKANARQAEDVLLFYHPSISSLPGTWNTERTEKNMDRGTFLNLIYNAESNLAKCWCRCRCLPSSTRLAGAAAWSARPEQQWPVLILKQKVQSLLNQTFRPSGPTQGNAMPFTFQTTTMTVTRPADRLAFTTSNQSLAPVLPLSLFVCFGNRSCAVSSQAA